MSLTTQGPTQQQVQAWLKDLEGLQLSIHMSNSIDSKVYVKGMLNILEDLVESFCVPPRSPAVVVDFPAHRTTRDWEPLGSPCPYLRDVA